VRADAVRNEPAFVIRSNWDTSYYSNSLQAGAVFSPWKQTVLKPHAGLRYSRMKISKYFERSECPLIINDFSDACSQVIYGLAASRKFTVLKRSLAADISIGRKQTVGAPRATLETCFYNAPETLVPLRRGDYYASLTTLGLSARMALSRHTLAGLSLDYETSSSRTSTTFSALVGYSW
jgi:hypothetical protein